MILEASVCESTERRDNLAALLFRGQRDEQWGVSPEGSGDRHQCLLLSDESEMGTLVTAVEVWCAGEEGLKTAEGRARHP